MKTICIQLAILAVFALACKTPQPTKNKNSHKNYKQDTNKTSTPNKIQLNNGKKWQVNAEMKPFIEESQQILVEYVITASTDYKTLAMQLKEKNAALIKSCTMQGKSHDELHKWLHPHMELIESLSKAENADAANTIVAQLIKSFETYSTYFE